MGSSSNVISAEASETVRTSASDKVWGNVELRDMILLHLPLRDLIKAQSVCKSWRDSEQVHAALFLRPYSASRVEVEDEHHWNLIKQPGENEHDVSQLMVSGPIFNPFMQRFVDNGGIFLVHILHRCWSWKDHEYQEFDKLGGPDTREDASWRKMQVLQPAASTIMVKCLGDFMKELVYLYDDGSWEGGPEEWERMKRSAETPFWLAVHNANGVTWGQLVSEMEEHFLLCDDCQDEGAQGGCDELEWPWLGCDGMTKIDMETTGYQMLAKFTETVKNKAQEDDTDEQSETEPPDHVVSETEDQSIESDQENVEGATVVESGEDAEQYDSSTESEEDHNGEEVNDKGEPDDTSREPS